ncbi:MAG: HIT family protein [Chitinophagales bacterium]
MPSIFTRIICGEIPSIIIDENEHAIAIMDAFPLRSGHVLVIPRVELDKFYELNDEIYTSTNLLAKRVSKAMEAAIDCERIGFSVIGLEIPHAHIHLVPINTANDINFAQEKLKMTQAEIQELADRIKKELKN